MPASLHVLGVVVLDSLYFVPHLPRHDEKVFTRKTEFLPGGPASFVARTAARLGAEVVLETAVGADAAGDQLIAAYEAAGIRTDSVLRLSGERTPVAVLIIDDTGEKAIILVPIPEEWLMRYGTSRISTRAPFSSLICSIRSRSGSPPSGCALFGGLSLLDLEWPEVDRWGFDTAMEAARDIDVICTNGQLLAARMGSRDVDAAYAFAAKLSVGRRAACVTLGAEGVVVAADGKLAHLPAWRVKADNTTGAGDTFIATFALALAESHAPFHAAAMANCASGWFLAGRTFDLAALSAAASDMTPTTTRIN
ncbi:carbohydrate kinase family protein [Rhizobium rhizogenes]